jgi:hypothetical protein
MRRAKSAIAVGVIGGLAFLLVGVGKEVDPVGVVESFLSDSPGLAARAGESTHRPPAPGPLPGFSTARLTNTTLVRSSPGGRPMRRLSPRTEFGSRRVFSVVEERGGWLGVLAPELGNKRIGWITAGDTAPGKVSRSLHIDVSSRTLRVAEGGRTVRRIKVAVGRPDAPTPTGRYAVTDKLPGADFHPAYGCCVVALSARMPKIPPGWTGGDRIAIHATTDLSAVGTAASNGCLRASTGEMRQLMREVPLGAPVFVRS